MWTLLLLAAHFGASAFTGCDTGRATLEIRNVHILDPETGNVLRHATIAISGNRICRIGTASRKPVRGMQVIEGRGRYALPGFTAAAPAGAETRCVGYGITHFSPMAPLRADAPDADFHEQLLRLVTLGRTPIQALQAATLKLETPSPTYGHSRRLESGSEASLLLLEQDPREDIAHTRSISLVVLRGQPLGLVALARARAGREIDLQPFSRQ